MAQRQDGLLPHVLSMSIPHKPYTASTDSLPHDPSAFSLSSAYISCLTSSNPPRTHPSDSRRPTSTVESLPACRR